MAISEKLQGYLRGANVKFTSGKHQVVYTAQEIAATQHVPGRQLAKCVLVNTDHGPVLAVLPAVYRIDLKKLKNVIGAKTLTIAKEADIRQRFPDVEVGAMSPFGNLYGVPVIADRTVGEAEEIVFNGGTHADTVRMAYQDFARLASPKVGNFIQPLPGSRKKKSRTKAAGKKTGPKTKTPSRRKAASRARRTPKRRR